MCKEGEFALLLGKCVEGMRDTMVSEVNKCVVFDREVYSGRDGFVVWRANRQILVTSFLYEQLDTAHALLFIFSLLIILLLIACHIYIIFCFNCFTGSILTRLNYKPTCPRKKMALRKSP